MTPFWLGLCFFGVVAVPVVSRVLVGRVHRKHALQLGRALKLRYVSRWIGSEHLEGQVEGIPIRIQWTHGERKTALKLDHRRAGTLTTELVPPIAHISLDARDVIPRELSFEAEGLLGALGKLVTGPDVEIQDARFDADVLARGPAPTITALMDTKTRTLLRGLVSVVGLRIADGRIEVASLAIDDQHGVESLVGTLVEIARALEIDARRTVPKRLLENATRDPVAAVRQNNLSVLLAEYRDSPETEVAIAEASRDPDPGVAVIAASAAGAEGFAKLQDLASSSATSEAIRFVALRHLAKCAPTISVPLLERALDDVSPALRRLAVESLGRLKHRAALPRIIDACRDPDDALVLPAAAALGRMGADDDAALAALVHLLGHPSVEVRVTAARALGRVGPPGVVGALRPLTRRLSPANVKEAALYAIAQIRARNDNPGAGRLSLIEDSRQGAVSLDHEGGALSRPPGTRPE